MKIREDLHLFGDTHDRISVGGERGKEGEGRGQIDNIPQIPLFLPEILAFSPFGLNLQIR